MLSEFRLPALGADMEEGTVVQWNVAPGDTVHVIPAVSGG